MRTVEVAVRDPKDFLLMSTIAEGIAQAIGANSHVVWDGAYSVTNTRQPDGRYVNGYK